MSVKSLQRFTGKVISFTLAVPAARLYTREVNSSISKGLKSSKPVSMTRNLREELEHWKFLDSWNGFLPWRDERHCIVTIVDIAIDSKIFARDVFWDRMGARQNPHMPVALGRLTNGFMVKRSCNL